jgi:hypothetical protein
MVCDICFAHTCYIIYLSGCLFKRRYLNNIRPEFDNVYCFYFFIPVAYFNAINFPNIS